MPLGQWVAPALFEARQLISGWHNQPCPSTPWGLLVLGFLVVFITGFCCGAFISCLLLSGAFRRFLLLVGRAAFLDWGPRVVEDLGRGRLAEYRRPHRA